MFQRSRQPSCESFDNGFDPFDLAIRKDSPLFYEAYQHAMCKNPISRSPTTSTITMEKSCQVGQFK